MPDVALQPNLKDLVAFVAEKLASRPDAVRVEESTVDGSTVLKLSVAPDDLGRIIGRQGRTARALRAVLSAAAVKLHRRAVLEILE